ncbi:MAG: hypothetical protein AB7P67_14020 [Vicinamibacterales bacterium]
MLCSTGATPAAGTAIYVPGRSFYAVLNVAGGVATFQFDSVPAGVHELSARLTTGAIRSVAPSAFAVGTDPVNVGVLSMVCE